jgi:hypothetical protein
MSVDLPAFTSAFEDRTFVPARGLGEAGRRRGFSRLSRPSRQDAFSSSVSRREAASRRFRRLAQHAPTGFRKSWRKRVVNATLLPFPCGRGARGEGEPTGPCPRVNLRVSTICFDRRSFLWLRIERDHNLGQRQVTRQSRQTRTGFRRSGCRFLSEFADRSRAGVVSRRSAGSDCKS